MKNNLNFTETYRKLETALRDAGSDYKALEDNADEFKQGRLRICRQMRNYLTHQQDGGFLEISDKQISFLEAELKRAQESGDILKDHLRTVKSGCCTQDDLLTDVFAKMNRLSLFYIPVVDGNRICCGVLPVHEAIKIYTTSARPKTAKVKSVSKLMPITENECCDPLTKMEDVPEKTELGFFLCTEDGENDGKVLGTYIIQ